MASLSGVVTLIKRYPVPIIATEAPAAKIYLIVLDAILKINQSPPSSFIRLFNTRNAWRILEHIQLGVQKIVDSKTMALSQEDVNAALSAPDPSTKDFILQQTMLRVKDPKVSLDFYSRVLGMRLLTKYDFPEMTFSLFFMGFEKEEDMPSDPVERTKWVFMRKATLELTHNWGTENDHNASYHNGNSEPKGFGHIGVVVPDVDKACERFEQLGVQFVKKPNDGKIKGIAFIKDPDGYWIEILNGQGLVKICH